jgi:hypothetical protein
MRDRNIDSHPTRHAAMLSKRMRIQVFATVVVASFFLLISFIIRIARMPEKSERQSVVGVFGITKDLGTKSTQITKESPDPSRDNWVDIQHGQGRITVRFDDYDRLETVVYDANDPGCSAGECSLMISQIEALAVNATRQSVVVEKCRIRVLIGDSYALAYCPPGEGGDPGFIWLARYRDVDRLLRQCGYQIKDPRR